MRPEPPSRSRPTSGPSSGRRGGKRRSTRGAGSRREPRSGASGGAPRRRRRRTSRRGRRGAAARRRRRCDARLRTISPRGRRSGGVVLLLGVEACLTFDHILRFLITRPEEVHVSPPLVRPHTPQLTAVQAEAAKLRAVWRRDNLHDGRS